MKKKKKAACEKLATLPLPLSPFRLSGPRQWLFSHRSLGRNACQCLARARFWLKRSRRGALWRDIGQAVRQRQPLFEYECALICRDASRLGFIKRLGPSCHPTEVHRESVKDTVRLSACSRVILCALCCLITASSIGKGRTAISLSLPQQRHIHLRFAWLQ